MPRFLGHEWRDGSDLCTCHGYQLDAFIAALKAEHGVKWLNEIEGI